MSTSLNTSRRAEKEVAGWRIRRGTFDLVALHGPQEMTPRTGRTADLVTAMSAGVVRQSVSCGVPGGAGSAADVQVHDSQRVRGLCRENSSPGLCLGPRSRADLRWGADAGLRRIIAPSRSASWYWEITADNPYTGYFHRARRVTIGRFSSDCNETKRGRVARSASA